MGASPEIGLVLIGETTFSLGIGTSRDNQFRQPTSIMLISKCPLISHFSFLSPYQHPLSLSSLFSLSLFTIHQQVQSSLLVALLLSTFSQLIHSFNRHHHYCIILPVYLLSAGETRIKPTSVRAIKSPATPARP